MEGYFLTPRGTPHFTFEVAKYWTQHDRVLEINFDRGRVTFSYEKPFEMKIELNSGVLISCELSVEHYPCLAFLDFKEFIGGRQSGHLGRAAAIVRFNETMRKCGSAGSR